MGTKIYCCAVGADDWWTVYALTECTEAEKAESGFDLKLIASHVSSNPTWAQHDIGITSDWKHEHYREVFPEGYELEWIDEPRSHPVVSKAFGERAG